MPGFLHTLCKAAFLAVLQLTAADSHFERRTASNDSFVALSRPERRAATELRLLAIGDSITDGYGSANKWGYRLALLESILYSKRFDKVRFIGGRSSGDYTGEVDFDNRHEGYGGYKIKQIQDAMVSDGILSAHPNIMLVHAGTNDVWQDGDQATRDAAPRRLEDLIKVLVCDNPSAVIIVAKIVGNNYFQSRVDLYNRGVVHVVERARALGYKVVLADHSFIKGPSLADGVHPSDQGYKDMAYVWSKALSALPSDWLVMPGPDNGGGNGNNRAETCARNKLYWNQVAGGKQIAAGAHVPNDFGEPIGGGNSGMGFGSEITTPGSNPRIRTYTPRWEDQGLVGLGVNRDGSTVRMADLNGDGRADYLWLDPQTGALSAWLNYGFKDWRALNQGNPIASGVGPAANVYFADMNGDKRADYIYVHDNIISVYYNSGPFGDGWAFSSPVDYVVEGGNINFFTLLFCDYNGDGRADIIRLGEEATFDVFYIDQSTGRPSAPLHQQLGYRNRQDVYTGTCANVDGDMFGDFILVLNDGGLTATLNQGGGRIFMGDVRYVTRKNWALGAAPGPQVRLADYDGDGRDDYFIIDPSNGAVRLFLNVGLKGFDDNGGTGGGGTNGGGGDYSLGGVGGALRLADLDGDGRDDYISVGGKAELIAYFNRGPFGDSWNWQPVNQGNLIAGGHTGATRHQIQFADLNGDGRADYLVVDDANGAVICYLNGGLTSDGQVIWWPKGQVAAGLGRPGVGVRFADLNGDGRDDYIWLDEDGRAILYLNAGSGDQVDAWIPVNGGNFIAAGVGGKRVDIRFADIDGDGKDDYIWLQPDTGALDVWYSGGQLNGGWSWTPGGRIAGGIGYQSRQIRLARLGSSGRADYVGVQENNGALVLYTSGCAQVISPGTGGGGSSPPPVCYKPPFPGVELPTCPNQLQVFCSEWGCDDFPYTDYRSVPGRLPGPKQNYKPGRRVRDVSGAHTVTELPASHSNRTSAVSLGSEDSVPKHLEARAPGKRRRLYPSNIVGLVLLSLAYVDLEGYLRLSRGQRRLAYTCRGTSCEETEITSVSPDDANGNQLLPLPVEWTSAYTQVDHAFEIQTLAMFLDFATSGILPSGSRTSSTTISPNSIANTWNTANLLPNSPQFRYTQINDLLFSAYGDSVDVANMVPVRTDINRQKGRIMGLLDPIGLDNWRDRLIRVRDTNDANLTALARANLNEFFTAYQYIREPGYLAAMRAGIRGVRNGLVFIEQNLIGDYRGIVRLWDEWIEDYFQTMVNNGYNWGYQALIIVTEVFDGRTDMEARRWLASAAALFLQLEDIEVPGFARPQ